MKTTRRPRPTAMPDLMPMLGLVGMLIPLMLTVFIQNKITVIDTAIPGFV